ncbi:MAG: hypothetical protein ACXVPR_03725 [Actinomycetota bacterium]
MGGSAVYADRIEDDVWLALGDPDGTAAALRSRADQVLAGLGDALQAGRSPEERIEALIETYMQGALQLLCRRGVRGPARVRGGRDHGRLGCRRDGSSGRRGRVR